MAENKMNEVAKLLGVELEEEFKIYGFRCGYKLTNDGLMYWSYLDSKWLISTFLKELLTGELKIIKLPKPILDEKEKDYLSNVIKPFRKNIITIRKNHGCEYEYIQICIYRSSDIVGCEEISFPYFNKGEMYKGMELDKEYTLDELEL